jgi:error-prone DNA polymerase
MMCSTAEHAFSIVRLVVVAEPPYVPLWCRSNFSFLEGASHPEELIEEAHRLGLPSIAIADRDGVHRMVRAHVKARELGVSLVAGATITVAAPGAALVPSPVGRARAGGLHATIDDEDAAVPMSLARRGRTRRAPKRAAKASERGRGYGSGSGSAPVMGAAPAAGLAGATSSLVLLAIDKTGWSNLTRLITAGRRREAKGSSRVGWDEVCAHAGGLVALWGGEPSLLAADPALDAGADAAVARVAGPLRDAFADRLYAMITRHRRAEDVPLEARLRARAAALGLPIVAAGEVLYHSRARRPLHDVLTCIRHGVTLATAGRLLRANDEHDLQAPHRFAKLWADDPGAVVRTREIAARCRFSLAELRYRYPLERLPAGATTSDHLRALALAGAHDRYGAIIPDAVAAQLDKELALIEELDYGGYFLTMYEVVRFCRSRDILCQGRGSAANSAVCYCLGITAVDPVKMSLLFERFLSRERAEPPDIDLDIEHERREEVIQQVYRGYGRDHAAMVCNVIRYRPRSAVRDVGKALGLPETALDRAAKLLSHWGDVESAALEHALGDSVAITGGPGGSGSAGGDGPERASGAGGVLGHLARLASEILEFPRHLSIHPGGFVLGHEPVHDLVPIENATMPGRTVIQWDKDDLEDLGLFKLDLLALGALHLLHRAFDLIRRHRGRALTMATIPADDPDTYEMIRAADTVGTFQIESRAQMSMLPRLKPRTFYDLVIEVSIVRPGPISGGMVHPFLRRRNGEEEVIYPHPCLEPVLARTLGVPLFQEQVMKLAVVAADYTPGEADQLRRDMAAWRRSGRIEQHRERLIARMAAKGIAREFAERVFEQIRGFGEYGFPESHAASFALIAYATCYLRRHHLAEFTAALLDAQPMGFYAPATIVGDAQRHGLEIRPIDVNASGWDSTLEPTGRRFGGEEELALRMGLRWVRGLALADGDTLVRVRGERAFASLEDLVRRARLDDRAYALLAEAGALASLCGERRDALWQVRGWARRQDDALAVDAGGDGDDVRLARLSKLDTIMWDYQASDHSTRGHPLGPLREWMRAQRWPTARAVQRGRDGARLEYVGLVICRQRPGTAAGVTFMTLEDETGFVNVVVWKQVFDEHALVVRSASLLGVAGRLQVQESVVHLVAEKLWIPSLPRPVAAPASRDFH